MRILDIYYYWLVLVVILAFFDLKKSVGLLIAYLLLVPYSSFKYALVPIEFNYIVFVVFCLFLINERFVKKESFDLTFVKPLAIFCLLSLLGSLFADGLKLSIQLINLRSFILYNLLIPIILWQLCRREIDVRFFTRVVLFCLVIMNIYAIYCFFSGLNPYVTVLSILYRAQDNAEVFANTERGGLVGRVQSTTFHPMFWSVILVLSLFASYIFYHKDRKMLFYTIAPLVMINLLICGVRSGIFAFFAGLLVFFTRSSSRSILILFSCVLFLFLIGIDTSIFGQYQPYVDSIVHFADTEKNIRGSTVQSRLSQLDGAVNLWVNGGLIVGKGFGWCANYYATKGDHPAVLGFESIVYIVIIDSGVLGIILWTWLFYSFFRLNHLYSHNRDVKFNINYRIIESLIVSFIVFLTATGIFGLNYFLIILVLVIKQAHFDNLGTLSYT